MENQEQTKPQPELSLADLQNLRVVVEMAVRRGAFAASELSSVGAVYDRLNGFLSAVVPPETAASAGEEPAADQPAAV